MIPVHHMRTTTDNVVQSIQTETAEAAVAAVESSPPPSSSSTASTMFALPRVNLKTSSNTLALTNSTDDAHHYAPPQHNGHHQHHPEPNTSFEPSATSSVAVAHGRGPPQSAFAASLLHYSTEKSGSSGYYSSHIYSTSSFDEHIEHIYSEPVSGTGSVGAAAAASRGIAGGGIGGVVVVALDAALPSLVSKQTASQPASASTHAPQMCRESPSLTAAAASALDLVDVRRLPAVAGSASADHQHHQQRHHPSPQHLLQHHQSAGLVNLESSIKNLELHLKAFSRPAGVGAVHPAAPATIDGFDEDDSSGSIDHKYDKRKSVRLPTIMEGIDGQPQPQMAGQQAAGGASASGTSPRVAWQDLDLDDSLMDLDLDSFMMANELAAKPAAVKTPVAHPSPPFVVAGTVDEGAQTDAALSYDNKSIENNYKCRKYINSCPDDPYNIDEPIGGSNGHADQPPPPTFNKTTLATYLHQCNDRVHYQSTRHILEEIRLKLSTLLGSSVGSSSGEGEAANTLSSSAAPPPPTTETKSSSDGRAASDDTLQHSIESLKGDLDNYLGIMNASNEMEIRQLCNGLAKDHKLVTIQNALGNRGRRIHCPDATCSNYVPPAADVGTVAETPHTAATKATTAASVSSYTEREETQFDTVYVRDGFSFGYKSKIPFRLDFSKTQSPSVRPTSNTPSIAAPPPHPASHPIYSNSLQTQIKFKCSPCSSCEEMMNSTSSCADDDDDMEEQTISGEEYTTASTSDDMIRYHANGGHHQQHRYPAQMVPRYPANVVYDPRLIGTDELKVPTTPFYHHQQHQQQQQLQQQHHQSAEYHQDKPSIWEQYYGTNRMNHTFFKVIKAHHSIMSAYPSERPESDFTLDLPQAEQLRLKMKREKQFRHRCRIVTSFLSLVFFLLTVVVVSLLLTRGKHPFGSMI